MGKLCPQKISNFVFYYAPGSGSGSGARFLYYVPIPKNLPPKSIQFQAKKTKRTRMICSMLLVLIVFFFWEVPKPRYEWEQNSFLTH